MSNNIFKQLMSLHWRMMFCYLLLFLSGDILAKTQGEFSERKLLLATHNSFGVLVLLLLGWRVYLLVRGWGRKYRHRLPKLTGNWYFKTGLHTVLYLLMFAVPLTGYWLVNAADANRVNLFGLPMPDLFPIDAGAVAQSTTAHRQSSRAFKFLIFIHVFAQHRFVQANWRRLLAWIQTVSAKG
jgi:cytochrome b561